MPNLETLLARAIDDESVVDALDDGFNALGARYSGKVRENFSADGQRIIVVSDRVSAFDVVLGTIPFKGQVLNQLAQFWFERTAELMPNTCSPYPTRRSCAPWSARPSRWNSWCAATSPA